MRRLLLTISVLLLGSVGLWSQTYSLEKIDLEKVIAESQLSVPIVARARRYLTSYYGRSDFSSPQWVRVNDFLQWMQSRQKELDNEYAVLLSKRDPLSAEQEKVVLGAWLGMKYALDKIANEPYKQLGVILEEKLYETECSDYAYRGTIHCTKGDFVSKINIGLHEAVHLIPYVNFSPKELYLRRNRIEDDTYRELYTTIAQQRYALPVKMQNNFASGCRTFFPLFDKTHSLDLLSEYQEAIYALIDYDEIWEKEWPLDESGQTNGSLEDAVRTVVFDEWGFWGASDQRNYFYSVRVNEFLQEIGQEVKRTWCFKLPDRTSAVQISYLHSCIDEHQKEILELIAQRLRPLVSPNIPPIPKGYI